MIDFNKMEEKDFVFINKAFEQEEEKAFSDFLKSRKKSVRNTGAVLRTKKMRRATVA